jgi:hypothetical protein
VTLSSWYACCELQLTPRATADFLDIEACIADPGRDPQLVDCALTSLEFADPRVQALAVPDLVGLLVRSPSDDLRQRAAERVLAATGPVIGAGLLAGIAELSAGDLVDVISEITVPRPDRTLAEFADIAESAPVLLGLALLREALRAEAATASPDDDDDGGSVGVLDPLVRGEDALWYLTPSLTGSLGRLPQRQAVECLLLAEESPSALVDQLDLHSTGPWLGQPDLIRIRLLLELAAESRTDPAERAAWLCAEAATLSLYTNRTGGARAIGLDWLRLQRQGPSTDAAALVLWQAVAWELAVLEHAGTAAPLLTKAWAPSEPVKSDVVWLNFPGRRDVMAPPLEYLGRLRPRGRDQTNDTQIKVGSDTTRPNSPNALSLAFSPWLDRTTPLYHGADRDDANLEAAPKTFPALDDDAAVLRLLVNARTLVRLTEELLRVEGGAVPPALWDPFLNLMDVLSNVRLRGAIRTMERGSTVAAAQRRLSPVVLGLALAAHEHATRLAKGFLHADVPALLQEHLAAKGDTSGYLPRQQYNLYGQAAYMAVAHVAWETLSGQLRSTGSASSPWLRGGASSPAAGLLKTLFGPVWDRLRNPSASIQEPGLLLNEVLPSLAEKRAEAWDWRRVYVEATGRIGQNLVLLSPRMTLAEWERLTLDRRRFKADGAWFALLTEWLVVSFHEGQVVGDHPHLIAWRAEIEQINSPGTLSRAMRLRLTELLDRPARSEIELDVQRLALRAILEFSEGAVRYQDAAGVAVTAAVATMTSLDDSPTELAAEWLYALERPLDGKGDGRGPWAVRARQALIRQRRESARANVAGLLRTGVPTNYDQVLRKIDAAATTPVHPLARDDDRPHRRAVFERRADGDWSALTPVGADAENDLPGGLLPDVPGAVLGLVAGPAHTEAHAPILLNVGQEDLRTGPPLDWPVGTIVASQSGQVAELQATAGRAGDIVQADVLWADGRLSITPEGRQAWQCDAAHLGTWLPDILTARTSPWQARCLVRRQPDGSWVPLVRDFVRLIVALGSAADQQGTIVIVGESEADDGWVVEISPGLQVSVPADAITPDLLAAVEDARSGSGCVDRSLEGLRVQVKLQIEDNRAHLALAPTPEPVSDLNVRWRLRFREQRVHTAHRRGGSWELAPEEDDEGRGLVVRFIGGTGEPPTGVDQVRVRVGSGGWDERAQRVGVVAVAYLPDERLSVADWADHAALQQYLAAEPGTRLVLQELTGGSRDGYLDGVTSTGLPVSVAADSLSFLPGAPPDDLVRNRPVIVQTLVRRAHLENRSAIPVALDGVHAVSGSLHGLVARLIPGVDEVDLWLDCGGSSALVTVPISAFLTETGTVGSRVALRPSGDGWLVTTTEVAVLARTAWDLEEAAAPPGAVALDITDVPGYGTRLVRQHPAAPVLLLADPSEHDGHRLTCGVRANGRVHQVRRGFVKDLLGRPLDIVTVGSGSEPVVGHSARGLFKTPRPWLSAHLVVQRLATSAGEVWIDARRDFLPGHGRRSTATPAGAGGRSVDQEVAHLAARPLPEPEGSVVPAAAAHDLSWPIGYEDWRAEGTEHAAAEWVPGERGSVRLIGLAVPVDLHRPESGSIEVVTLEPGERSYLRGRGYDPRNVRVRLTHGHRGWTASYRTTPLTLAQFASDVLGRSGVPAQRQRIWFAGMTEGGRYRFEWGYGWTMELDGDELDLQDRRTPFFFGDCLQSLSIVRSSARDDARLRLRIGHVRWEVERLVHDDASQGVLHQVRARVQTGPDGRAWVNVDGVFHRDRAVPETGSRDSAAKYARMFNAEFDHDSQAVILDRLRGRADRTDPITVLARLDRMHVPGVGGNRRQRFIVLTPEDRAADQGRQPQSGESLVLVGRDIRRTGRGGKGNDYLLEFELPGAAPGDDEGFRVTVRRRQFSFRESTLRQAFRADSATYRGTPMLVKLTDLDAGGRWRGSVVDAPARPWVSLRAWAEAEPDRAYVTVGDAQGNSVVVEPRPGVVGRLQVSRQAAHKGSLCRLGVVAGKPTLVPVVPGEGRYVTRAGRPVHLLLKDDAFGRDSRGGFTVAGLPGIEVYHAPTAQTAKYKRPPRLGVITAREDGFAIKPGAAVRAGRLYPNDPHVRAFGNAELPDLAWPQLSYRDDSPKSVAAHCLRGAWHFHDTATRYLRRGELVEERFPDPVRSKDGPLFFDDRWHLRYRTEDLLTYGYSATELLEHGLPKDYDWYPVVAPSKVGGLWIETSPGRVVELGSPLLHSPATTASALDELPWGLFAAGDEIRLRSQQTHDGTRSFLLKDWQPGPRGWFRGARALLVPSRRDGAQVLGSGLGSLTWSGPDDLGSAPLWLAADNTLAPYADDVAPGDVVLLEHHNGSLAVHGISGAAVVLAKDWEGYDWLRDLLVDQTTAARLLTACGALAVRVTEVAGQQIAVRAAGDVPAGSVLAGRLLATLDDEHALFRSGSALLRLPLADLLPGVPASRRREAAAALSRRQRLLWLRNHHGRWVSPALLGTPRAAFVARPVGALADGVMMLRSADLAVGWLPVNELGWAEDGVGEHALAILKNQSRPLDLIERDGGSWSFSGTHGGQLVERQLGSGGQLQVVPHVLLGDDDGRSWTYLGTVYPTVALITVRSESALPSGEPIAAEVETVGAQAVAIPRGQRRTRLHLSRWLVAALRESRRDKTNDLAVVAERAQEHLAPYRRAASAAPPAGSLEERVVGAFAARVQHPSHWTPGARADLSTWLAGAGGAVLTGTTAIVAEDLPAHSWDLAPHLAAIGLLAEFGEQAASATAGRLAVHGLHALGQAAAGAQHQEVLLRHWLLAEGQPPNFGRWVRLSRLDLGGRTIPMDGGTRESDPYVTPGAASDPHYDGQLTRGQLEQLHHCCSGILDSWSEPDPPLGATARSLLFAAGTFPRADDLWNDLTGTELGELVALSRALTPGANVPVAQPRLTLWQRSELVRRTHACLGSPVPLNLLPYNVPALPSRLAAWAVREVAAVIEELGG